LNFLFKEQNLTSEKIEINRMQLNSLLGMFLFLSKKNIFIKVTKIQILRLVHSYFQTNYSISSLKKIFNLKSTYPRNNTAKNYSLSWEELSE